MKLELLDHQMYWKTECISTLRTKPLIEFTREEAKWRLGYAKEWHNRVGVEDRAGKEACNFRLSKTDAEWDLIKLMHKIGKV